MASGAGDEGGCVVSANFPPPDATRDEVDRFTLSFTHKLSEVVATYEDWQDGTYATDEAIWPERFNIAVMDARGRVVRCAKAMRRAVEDNAFPIDVWKPLVEAVKFISFAGANCERPCRGWDTKSNRCDCGNRRVYWDSNDGGKPFARAD